MKPLCWWFLLWAFSCSSSAATLSMQGVLGDQGLSENNGYKHALQLMAFQFPRDHLAHQAYRTEWWYFTGNVSTGNVSTGNVRTNNVSTAKVNEQAFAYQFTLFRFALQAETQAPETQAASAWRSKNIYMAHIALTDINQEKYYQQERFSRDGLGLAGAEEKEDGTLHFWLNDWQVTSLAREQLFPLRLTLKDQQFALDLQLQASKPMVLQGEQGLSQKSREHASYYYSYTRLSSQGEISIGDKSFRVSGDSWFDREWSTSSLAEDQQGWDWIALHLEDGSDLMLYQMRKKDGSKDVYSSGTLVDAQGKSTTVKAHQFQLQATDFWRSPASSIRYPIQWQVAIPEHNIKLTVSTQVKQQEWSQAAGFSFNYWEGAVEVKGSKNHQPISGSGYLEMTGYD